MQKAPQLPGSSTLVHAAQYLGLLSLLSITFTWANVCPQNRAPNTAKPGEQKPPEIAPYRLPKGDFLAKVGQLRPESRLNHRALARVS